ncbi:MAG: hypothetical protein QXG91_00175 [Candidatus Aenigmatarchaeota archaeon]
MERVSLEEFLMNDEFWNSVEQSFDIPLQFAEQDPIVGHEEEKRIIREQCKKYVQNFYYFENEMKKVDYNPKEIDKIRNNFNPIGIVLIGKYGSAKSREMQLAQIWIREMLEELGIKGFDYVAEIDKTMPLGFVIKRYEHPYGIQLREAKIRRIRKIDKIKSILLKAILGSAGFFLLYQTIGFIFWFSNFIPNTLFNIGLNLWYDLPRYLQIGEFLTLVGIYYTLSYFKKRVENNLPNIIASTADVPEALIGKIDSGEFLLGKYDHALSDKPPQNRFVINPALLKFHGNVFAVENLHELTQETQELIAQVIEEKKKDVSNLGDSYTQIIYPFFFFTLNPDRISNIKEVLRAKTRYFVVLEVRNEVENNKRNRRHLMLLLSYRYKHLNFSINALKEIVNYCEFLADDRSKLYVSRKIFSIPTYLEDNEKELIEKSDVRKALEKMLTVTQTSAIAKIEELYNSYNIKTSGSEIGRCNVICKYLHREASESGTLEIHVSNEDYISYVIPIKAVIKKNGKGDINIITRGLSEDEIKFYTNSLKSLLHKEIKDNDIYISVPCLSNDETLLAGMYIAAYSALKRCKVDLSNIIALNINSFGETSKLPFLNLRMFYTKNILKNKKVIVSKEDLEYKVNKEYIRDFIKTNIVSVEDLNKLFEEIEYGRRNK